MCLLHCHPIGEFLKGLTVQGESHTSISIKGELHTIQNLGLPTLFGWSVRIIFVPIWQADPLKS